MSLFSSKVPLHIYIIKLHVFLLIDNEKDLLKRRKIGGMHQQVGGGGGWDVPLMPEKSYLHIQGQSAFLLTYCTRTIF